jgi:glycogen(starch) synthase
MLSWNHVAHAAIGTSAHVEGLGRALCDAGHDVVVLTVDDPGHDDAPRPPRPAPPHRRSDDHHAERPLVVESVTAGLPWIDERHDLARTISANHALVERAVRATGPDRFVPDVVHAHDWEVSWAADTLAAVFGVPLVTTFHGLEQMRHSGMLPAGRPSDVHAIEWWLALRSSAVIAATHLMVEQLVSGFELDPERIVRIPNGIDPTGWREGEAARLPAGERDPLVVAWGNILYEKGFQVLARAVQVLRHDFPETRCTIVGRGRYLAELQTQIDVEGVSDVIDLPGYLPVDELRALVSTARCVVVPSLYEPFGIVALEALAAGAPLVVARTGGLAELVAGTGAGLTFEPGSPYSLADAVGRILADGELADRLTAHARALVDDQYTWTAIADRTIACYRSAVPRRR